jgi:UDP-N-acetylglucosamine/UDP-N-acetylgalactosamine diphosphorylase
MDYFSLAETLRSVGQEHLLSDIAQLDEATRNAYFQRLAAINWQELQASAKDHAPAAQKNQVNASRIIQAHDIKDQASVIARGEAAYRAGQVAVLMVAGGQGTRLGSDAPKGCFQVAPHSGKSIYQLHAEKVIALNKRIGRTVPFLIMTSPATDAETREFIQAHGYFGLPADSVHIFSQGTVPSIDEQGRAVLAKPGQLLENPDGHGGCFTAFVSSGKLATLVAAGVKHLIYIQVDNILSPVDDALLIGLSETERSDVITKVVEKSNPDERVGHLVSVGGRDRMVEYTEITPEQAREKDAHGQLIYRWGNTAMHCWSIAFLHGLVQRGFTLPLHRSKKPLKAWVDGREQTIQGWKSERFIFDLLPQANKSIGLAVDRAVEFAPVKNADRTDGKPNNDSPATAVHLASDLYARWLRAAGVRVELPPAARIEISPTFAATQAQFLQVWDKRVSAVTGDFYLEG